MQSPRWFDASTRNRRLLALVLLAVAVAVPIGIWRAGAPLPVGKPEEERAFEPALPEVTKTSRSESTTQDLPASRIALQQAASSGTRATSVGREIRVHVLDSTTEATVPSAEIRWIEGPPQPGSGAETAIWRRQVDPEPWFREQGRVVIADADGLATIRSAAKSVWVSVRREGLYGEARCDPATTREVWVRLEPDIALEVHVSSVGGTPCAGVDVILQASPPNPRLAAPLQVRETAAGTGIARFFHLQSEWSQNRAARPPGVEARVTLPGIEIKSPRIATSPPPSAPVELVLPATGSLEVAIEEAPGKLLRGEAWAVLRLVGTDPGAAQIGVPESGIARYERVALDQRFAVRAEGDVASWPEISADGPTRAGEVVQVRLARASALPVFVGRLVAKPGEPVRRVGARLSLTYGTGSTWRQRFETDADGRFSVTAPSSSEAQEITAMSVALSGAPHELWRLEHPYVITRGQNDFGDLRLESMPKLVSGSVVDSSGAPVEGANVSIQHALGERVDVTTRTTAKGHFEVLGFAPPGGLTLLAVHPLYLRAQAVPFERGAENLRLVLTRAATLRVAVSVERDIAEPALWLRLVDSTTRARAPERGGALRDGYAAVWNGVAPGHYELQVGCTGERLPFHTLRDVEVAAGETSLALDLRGRLRVLQVRILDREDRPIRSPGSLRVLGENAATGLIGIPIHQGEALLVTSRLDLRIAATVRGMRQGELEVRLGEGTTRRDLRLEPTTWIAEVTLKGPTPGELERVVVFLAPPGSAAYCDAWLLDQAADLGAVARGTRGAGPGEFTFRLPRDGDWELAVFHRDDLEHPIAMTPSRITVGTGQNSITAAAGARKAR